MNRLIDAIDEYASSQYFLFLDASLKPHAETLLTTLCQSMGGAPTIAAIEQALRATAPLDLTLEVRKALPRLLKEFFGFLAASGRYPHATEWSSLVSLAEPTYLESIRADGSVKGETFRKKYTDVGRNDPCPCGSGKKFKKCCAGLMG